MPESKVSIVNRALGHIRYKNRMQAIGENSPEGRQAALWYDNDRRQVLEHCNWSFARRRVALALHDEDPPDEWGYRYIYPADCVALRHLVNPNGRNADMVPFRLEVSEDGEQNTILTDLEGAYGVYTFDQDTPALYTGLFVNMFSHLLAHHMAGPLTNDQKIVEGQLKLYNYWARIAEAANQNEGVDDLPKDAPWISGR